VLEVVSVSLGSSSRDTDQVVELLGRQVRLRRVGADGDLARAEALVRELDGKVDAFGLGGLDLYFPIRGRRYYLRDALRLARAAQRTPAVCGAGLKETLERRAVRALAPRLGLETKQVLMVSAVDRFGMAEELYRAAGGVTFGDLVFALGVPVGLHRLATLERIARLLLPVMTRVPIAWLYPVGAAQEKEPNTARFARYYDRADVIAGDWHFIKRYAPEDLAGKVLVTNTTTLADLEFMRRRGVATLVTTTPRYGGRSISTNLLEAAFVALEGAGAELTPERYAALIEEARLEPTVMDLSAPAEGAPETGALPVAGDPVPTA